MTESLVFDSSKNIQITFSIPFTDTNYSITLGPTAIAYGGALVYGVTDKKANGFKINCYNSLTGYTFPANTIKFDWIAIHN